MSDYSNIMVDLETLGTRAGCVILSIGAVQFSRDSLELGEKFYTVINTKSCMEKGLFIERSTAEWWDSRTESAKIILELCKNDHTSSTLPEALSKFNDFFEKTRNDHGGCMLWGNGSDFDNAILVNAYAACGIEMGSDKLGNRCYRTLKNEYPNIELRRSGVHHNALDDAISQANHATQIFESVRREKFELMTLRNQLEEIQIKNIKIGLTT